MKSLAFLFTILFLTVPGISMGVEEIITGPDRKIPFVDQDPEDPFDSADDDPGFTFGKTGSDQTPLSMTLTSATATFDPKKKDKFVLKGTTGSLALTGATSVIFEAGSFKQEITLDKFTQSKQKYTFKGATGAAGIASLILDMPKGQFSATVQNLFLTGFTNPLPVSLKAGTSTECRMVQFVVSKNKWTFSGSSSPQYACLITQVPKATPIGLFVNTPKNITIQAMVPSNEDLKTDTVQLFQVDDGLNPAGSPLCALLDNGNSANGDQKAGDSVYSCMVTLQESSPGKVYLMVGAQLGGKITYSPSFSLEVVTPYTEEQAQQTVTAHGKAGEAWQDNLAKYGDTKKARDQTVKAVKKLDGVKDAGISSDGASVWVEFKSGIRGGIAGLQTASDQRNRLLGRPQTSSYQMREEKRSSAPCTDSTGTARQVSESSYPVKNCKVLLWEENDTTPPNKLNQDPYYNLFSGGTGEVPTDSFSVTMDNASSATGCQVASLRKFVDYGTIIIGHSYSYRGKHSLVIVTNEEYRGVEGFEDLVKKLLDETTMIDLLTGCLEIFSGPEFMVIGFTPNFIATLDGDFKNSIILIEADNGYEFADSFLKKGAHTFFGFMGEHGYPWTREVGLEIFRLMTAQGMDAGAAYAALSTRNNGNSSFLKYSNSTTEVGYKGGGCYLLEWVDADFPPSAYLPPSPVHSIDKYSNANVLHYKVEAEGRKQDLFVDIFSYEGSVADSEWSKQANGLRELATQEGAELIKNDSDYVVPGYKSTHKDGGYAPGTWALKFYKGNIIQVMSFRCYVEYDGNRYDTNCTDSRIPGLSKDQLLARYDREVQIAIGIIDAKCSSQNGCID